MARTIADGAGRNSGLTRPVLPAACQIAMTSASAIQPPKRLLAGTKPAPRKRTRRTTSSLADGPAGARSSMLNLALGIDRLVADQRPDLVLKREQLFTGCNVTALSARHRHAHDLANAARTPRQHHDAIGKPRRLFEIMRDIDRAHAAIGEQPDEILHQQFAGLRIQRRQRLRPPGKGRPDPQPTPKTRPL